MALSDHGISRIEGFVGATAEETIRNLSRIGTRGMGLANDQMLDIMIAKAGGSETE
jgi:L-cysteine desulfidase